MYYVIVIDVTFPPNIVADIQIQVPSKEEANAYRLKLEEEEPKDSNLRYVVVEA